MIFNIVQYFTFGCQYFFTGSKRFVKGLKLLKWQYIFLSNDTHAEKIKIMKTVLFIQDTILRENFGSFTNLAFAVNTPPPIVNTPNGSEIFRYQSFQRSGFWCQNLIFPWKKQLNTPYSKQNSISSCGAGGGVFIGENKKISLTNIT